MDKSIKLLKEHCIFTNPEDCYVLFAIARRKNNLYLTNSQEVVFRQVIKNNENIERKYNKLISQCNDYQYTDGKTDIKRKLNFYVYVSVNSRNALKAYIELQKRFNQYVFELLKNNDNYHLFKRLDSIWLSDLMKPNCKSSKRFLLDIDTKEQEKIDKISGLLDKVTLTIKCYKNETKNGFHYIMDPFDKQKFHNLLTENNLKDICEVKTDGLFFVENLGE